MRCFASCIYLIAILQLRTPRSEAVNVTDIRLVDQTTGAEVQQIGIVQIQVDGGIEWGAICDDAFADDDAVVVCRMLGFTNGGTANVQGTFPPGAAISFLMDDTGCSGDEPSLTECIAAQQSDCTVNTDSIVGVVCNNNRGPGEPTLGPATTTQATPDIISGVCASGTNQNPNVRLYGRQGVPGMGFVEVRNPNNQQQWGFVCDDRWDENAALVVCRELCYDTAAYTPKPGIPSENIVYPTNPSIVKDNVVCSGQEASLINCPSLPWGVENCENRELAGVQCLPAQSDPPPPPIPILLCREGKMIAQFSRQQDPDLEEKHLIVYNGGVACPDVVKETTNDYVIIEIPVKDCGTINTQSNTSHIVYTNTISYLYTTQEGFITRKNTYQVRITCALPTELAVTQRVQPLTETVTQKATGTFVVRRCLIA
ncbi:protocadherin fat 4-like [Plakobranchus ocellatus]|uniref:Protocadherin fat 4-like n=1 Tax=Plakobranchus ocellatus TaxID=259542 RepID=A0AAV4AHU9_9GAST|nr:protocadherin fat 4-like [Plakobranchus ocellatus]